MLGLVFAVFSGASALGRVWCGDVGEPAAALPDLPLRVPARRAAAVRVVRVRLAAVARCWRSRASAGFASGFLNPILGAVIFERIPSAPVGRVSSLNHAMCWALMPLGGLVGGLLVDCVGLRPRAGRAAARRTS